MDQIITWHSKCFSTIFRPGITIAAYFFVSFLLLYFYLFRSASSLANVKDEVWGDMAKGTYYVDAFILKWTGGELWSERSTSYVTMASLYHSKWILYIILNMKLNRQKMFIVSFEGENLPAQRCEPMI